MKKLILLTLLFGCTLQAQQIGLLKYNGGGDWYGNPTALPNLISFCNTNINTKIAAKPVTVEAGSTDIFQYPYIHMTGHGNVFFSEDEAENLRNYMRSGGLLHVDDNYGIRKYLERELQKIFPNKTLEELPASHPIFHQTFTFSNGLPKIHEHDGKRPQAFGIFENDRLIFLFTFESDLGDGWENEEVHNDPESIRLKALQMGANIIQYAFEQ